MTELLMDKSKYTEDAIERAKRGALDYLIKNGDGYPRSWEEEHAVCQLLGHVVFDYHWEAPPIAGYEALELDGLADRLETVMVKGEERVHFRLKDIEISAGLRGEPREPEIEITPAMIEAGASVLWEEDGLDLGPISCRILAEAILRGAFSAKE